MNIKEPELTEPEEHLPLPTNDNVQQSIETYRVIILHPMTITPFFLVLIVSITMREYLS